MQTDFITKQDSYKIQVPTHDYDQFFIMKHEDK